MYSVKYNTNYSTICRIVNNLQKTWYWMVLKKRSHHRKKKSSLFFNILFKINKKSKKNKASQPFSCLPICLQVVFTQTKRRQITIFIMLRRLILLHFKFYLTVCPGYQFIIGPSYFRLFSMFLLSSPSLDITGDNAQTSR